jgi:hypothetical protein
MLRSKIPSVRRDKIRAEKLERVEERLRIYELRMDARIETVRQTARILSKDFDR